MVSRGSMNCVNAARHAAQDLGKMYNSQPHENEPISEYRITFYRGNEASILQDLIARHRERVLGQEGIDIGGMTDLGFWGKILVREARHRIVDLFDELDLAMFDISGVPIYMSHCYQAGNKIPRPSESDWTVYAMPSVHSCPIGRVIVSDTTTEPGVWWVYGLLDFSGISRDEDAGLRTQLLNKRLGGLSVALEYTKHPGEKLPELDSSEIRGSPTYTLHCGRQVRFREISLVPFNDCPEARIVTIKAAEPGSLDSFNALIRDVTTSPTKLIMDSGTSAAAAPTSSSSGPTTSSAPTTTSSAMDVDSHADKKGEKSSTASGSTATASSSQGMTNTEISKQVEAIMKAREASMAKQTKSSMDVDPKPVTTTPAPETKRADPEESVRDKAFREMAEKLEKAQKRMEAIETEAGKRAEAEAKSRADHDDVKKRAKALVEYGFPRDETRALLSKVDVKERDSLQAMLVKQVGGTGAGSKSKTGTAPSGPLGTMWEPARPKAGGGSGAAAEPMAEGDRLFQKSGDKITLHPSITPDKITPELAALERLVNRDPKIMFEANSLAPLFMKQ